jgi:hypothetical protein
VIARHDEWLKRKFTDGRSWYDIISDTMSGNSGGAEDVDYVYDLEEDNRSDDAS